MDPGESHGTTDRTLFERLCGCLAHSNRWIQRVPVYSLYGPPDFRTRGSIAHSSFCIRVRFTVTLFLLWCVPKSVVAPTKKAATWYTTVFWNVTMVGLLDGGHYNPFCSRNLGRQPLNQPLVGWFMVGVLTGGITQLHTTTTLDTSRSALYGERFVTDVHPLALDSHTAGKNPTFGYMALLYHDVPLTCRAERHSPKRCIHSAKSGPYSS
jgi:hypothetical protein